MSIRSVPFREKNVRYNRVLVVTELIVSGTRVRLQRALCCIKSARSSYVLIVTEVFNTVVNGMVSG